MNKLSIRPYHLQKKIIDNNVNTIDQLLQNKYSGNISLEKSKLLKPKADFYEFYIDEIPLHKTLEKFYKRNVSIFEDWKGVLGPFKNHPADLLKIKELLLEPISDTEIIFCLRNVWFKDHSKEVLEQAIENFKYDLSLKGVLLYCCRACEDYTCGGYFVDIKKTDSSFIWSFEGDNNNLEFIFEMHEYVELFKTILKEM